MLADMPATVEVREELRRSWKWTLAAGIVALIAGILSILLVPLSSVAVSTLVGWLLIVAAIFTLVDAFAIRMPARIVGRVLLAALYAFAGIYLLLAPLDGTVTLTFVLIVLFIADGALRIFYAIREGDAPARGMLALSGVLSILLGILIWVDFPSSAAWAIGTLVGINLIFWGANMLAIAWVGRKVAKGLTA